ncbi:MAG: SRPBCC family protein [Bdellovibrionaceae bacterium]|nr:SRPBCC family protein [Pseudobdellovibrionaceae bacterium]
MAEKKFESNLIIERPIDEVFAFFSKAENLQRITPPSLDFFIVTPLPIEMKKGTLIDYRLKIRGVPSKWKTLISEWSPPTSFTDTQLKGPYKKWVHNHKFTKINDRSTQMVDTVVYEVPFGILGNLVNYLIVRHEVAKIFKHRNKTILKHFETKPV